MESQGAWTPWLFLVLFLVASGLMIWRLEAMSERGFEGTVLGTLVMPYCSGMVNLILAFIYGRNGFDGADIANNNLVNNATNMTLVLGLPAIFWGINVLPSKGKNAPKKKAASPGAGKAQELNRLSLLFTLTAVLFFTGVVWALSRKGSLNFNDGLVLVGFFLFWQCIHVFEVMKSNVRQGRSMIGWMLPLDIALLAVGSYGIYVSIDWLVHWVRVSVHPGFIKDHFGMISGWITVLPNALLAIYYTWRKQPETVYASQVGDCHVSIPLCLWIYALYYPLTIPPFFQMGMMILVGATVVHLLFVAIFGQLPRFAGWLLVIAYGFFLWKGLIG